jgi:hypothetical protein
MIRAAIELPADVLRCMESAAALAGAAAGLAGVTALAAAIRPAISPSRAF